MYCCYIYTDNNLWAALQFRGPNKAEALKIQDFDASAWDDFTETMLLSEAYACAYKQLTDPTQPVGLLLQFM